MGAAAHVRVKLLRPGAQMPYRATEHATGFDLFACFEDPAATVTITQVPVVVGAGIAIEVPPGFDAQVRPRSGLARKGVLSTFGTIDADYRGELLVTLYAIAPGIEHVIHHGDRIAQLVIAYVPPVTFEQAAELSQTSRGEGGHGSTGR